MALVFTLDKGYGRCRTRSLRLGPKPGYGAHVADFWWSSDDGAYAAYSYIHGYRILLHWEFRKSRARIEWLIIDRLKEGLAS